MSNVRGCVTGRSVQKVRTGVDVAGGEWRISPNEAFRSCVEKPRDCRQAAAINFSDCSDLTVCPDCADHFVAAIGMGGSSAVLAVMSAEQGTLCVSLASRGDGICLLQSVEAIS